ncbi:hypothetical protein P879_03624 [Paragonimus westermani]|uniref:EF-hand domain-containing protein n=1 Tax=Paragonimus westermani TaxID=34504 RepID=A0A8T0DGF7_9TREM|nr:hypothetical protein P879_03624 [Paragonimus westermani]
MIWFINDDQHEEHVPVIEMDEKEVESLFHIIDRDGNGKITRSELTAFFRRSNQKLGAKEIKEYIKQFDVNNDGKITLEELKAVFLKR